jgi:GNAT superfamily N-acetyltransferase
MGDAASVAVGTCSGYIREVPCEVHVVPIEREHVPAVLALFAAERWSYGEDGERAWRALTAPGSLTVVAIAGGTVLGVAQVVGDGEVQAFLSVLLVAKDRRRTGVARRLVHELRTRSRGLRLDAISCADPFYESLGFRRVSGFRIALDLAHGAEPTPEVHAVPPPAGRLTYLFWHRPENRASLAEYERHLIDFHEALARVGVSSASFRVERLPFARGAGYEDWYLAEDWSQLGRLGGRATGDAQGARHDALARLSGDAWGGVYALVCGEAEPPDGARWVDRARGEAYKSFLERQAASTIWQRQLVLGPAPEFCVSEPPPSGRRRLWPR